VVDALEVEDQAGRLGERLVVDQTQFV
jgi:hypothetical protein